MIEMHQDDPLGDDDFSAPSRGGTGIWSLAFGAPAMAIAALVVGLGAFLDLRSAEVVGQTLLFSAKDLNRAELTNVRGESFVQLIAAVVALGLAIAASLRIRTENDVLIDELDEDDGADDLDVIPADPLWVRGIAGAALIVAVLAIIAAGGAFIFAAHAHLSQQFLNN